jgi:hypothetical protein
VGPVVLIFLVFCVVVFGGVRGAQLFRFLCCSIWWRVRGAHLFSFVCCGIWWGICGAHLLHREPPPNTTTQKTKKISTTTHHQILQHRKLKRWATRTPPNTGNVLKCSGRVNSQLCIQCCATQWSTIQLISTKWQPVCFTRLELYLVHCSKMFTNCVNNPPLYFDPRLLIISTPFVFPDLSHK